ncbi:unnamed protein product [Schistosoma turkestanicum]|nr:unnamed protein product [Schistosoma turkestanicum]
MHCTLSFNGGVMNCPTRRLALLSACAFYPGSYSARFSTTQKRCLTKVYSEHPDLIKIVSNEFILKPDFVTEEEELGLIDELDSVLCKRKYQTQHWDYAIKNFRELERRNWHTRNQPVIDRLKTFTAKSSECLTTVTKEANVSDSDQLVLPLIHVLDLAENGEIMAHVDSVKFCGQSIAVLSLLDHSILRLSVAPHSEVIGIPQDQYNHLHTLHLPAIGSWIDIYIPRRSVYLLCGALRYLMTHAILSNEQVNDNRKNNLQTKNHQHQQQQCMNDLYNIHRGRRLSIICRTHAIPNLIPYYNTTNNTDNHEESNVENLSISVKNAYINENV